MDAASLQAINEQLAEWTDRQVLCRISGHAWAPSSVTHQPGWYSITQRCSRRCGCRRVQNMDERGYADKWKIIYPAGYLVHGFGRVDADGKAIIRLASIRNQTVVEVPPDE